MNRAVPVRSGWRGCRWAWAVAAAMLMLTGCVQRTISITSDPSGALVYVNDEEVGRTPVTVPFTYYGVYDVRVEAEGRRPLWTKARAKAPLWDLAGPDLIAEAVPGARSRIVWHFVLDPVETVDESLLIDRARQMRALTNEPR